MVSRRSTPRAASSSSETPPWTRGKTACSWVDMPGSDQEEDHAGAHQSRNGQHSASFANLTHRKGLQRVPQPIVARLFELHTEEAGHHGHGSSGIGALGSVGVALPDGPTAA